MNDFLPTRIGDVSIKRKIASGGMGTVYEGLNDRNEIVAIKVFDPSKSFDGRNADRFHKEIKALKNLPSHPNIVSYLDKGQEKNGVLFAVMEYISGQNLKFYLDKKERYRFSIGQTVRIMKSLLTGLQFCHEQGVVHRDIKPENIILTRNNYQVKIVDFGICKIEGEPRLTKTGAAVGTPAYASPEQRFCTKSSDIDWRTDIWSAGSVFYELLTGQNLFFSGSAKGLNTSADIPTALKHPIADLSQFEPILKKALEVDKKNRYQSANEFLNAIENSDINLNNCIDEVIDEIKVRELRVDILLAEYLAEINRFSTWLDKAFKDDLDCQWLVGLCYQYGCGTDQNWEEAKKWYTLAAKAEHPNAQYRLGSILETELCLASEANELEKEKIKEWYERAAVQDYPLAAFWMGLQEWGNIDGPNHKCAYDWFKKASDKQFPPAYESLGQHYDHGWHVPCSKAKAAQYYKKAAYEGDGCAMRQLAFMYRNGIGVEKNDEEAFHWLQDAAKYGDAIAQCELGLIYRNGDQRVSRNNQESTKWLQMAADQHYEPAEEALLEKTVTMPSLKI